jgi:hypothetical protein
MSYYLTCPDSLADVTFSKSMFLQDVRRLLRTQKYLSGHASLKVYFLIYVRTGVSHVRTPPPKKPFLIYFKVSKTYLKGLLSSIFFKNSRREFKCAKRRLFRLKQIYVFLLGCFFVVQPLKSNWIGASVKGSIEELYKQV